MQLNYQQQILFSGSSKGMLELFYGGTVSVSFKMIPTLLDLCYFHALSQFCISTRKESIFLLHTVTNFLPLRICLSSTSPIDRKHQVGSVCL